MKKFLMTLVIGMLGVTALGFSCGGDSRPAPTCTIFGATYNEGDLDTDTTNPNRRCYSCQPSKTANAWSQVADGTANCDLSDNTKSCKAGQCTNQTDGNYCNINGSLYPPGLNANNACQLCNPAPVNLGGSPFAWQLQPSGTPCRYIPLPDGGVALDDSRCDSSGNCVGTTPTQCHIADPAPSTTIRTYNPGDVNPLSPQCQNCNLTVTVIVYPDGGGEAGGSGGQFSWANINEHMACTARDRNGNVISHNGGNATGHCNRGFCDIYCSIGPAVPGDENGNKWESENSPTPPGVTPDLSVPHPIHYKTGDNPADSCQYCDAFQNGNGWSGTSDLRVCDSSSVPKGVCYNKACAIGCGISGTYYALNAHPANNDCSTCGHSGDQVWTTKPNNTVCNLSPHSFCENNGQCLSGCLIGGTFYNDGTTNPGNACQQCTATTSTSGWTNKAANASCGSNSYCESNSCTAGCFVSNTFYTPGTNNPSNSCQSCVGGGAFTNKGNGTSCTKSGGAAGSCNNGTCQ